MVSPDSHRISSVPWYSGTYSQPSSILLTGVSPSLPELPNSIQLSTTVHFMHALQPLASIQIRLRTYLLRSNPSVFDAKNTGESQCSPGLDCSLFARTTGGISVISLPAGTKIFQFPAFALLSEYPYGWVSPFRSPRIEACSAAPRGLSQPYHVFHRLPVPRHPPCTLSSLKISLSY